MEMEKLSDSGERWTSRETAALKITPAQARQVSTHWPTVAPPDIYRDIMQHLPWIESTPRQN
jgi:hypothetical protein